VRVEKSSYPQPDPRWGREPAFAAGLRLRWRDFEATRGPLSAVAYWLNRAITSAYGGENAAATHLAVSRNALEEFRKLAANDSERKAGSTAPVRRWTRLGATLMNRGEYREVLGGGRGVGAASVRSVPDRRTRRARALRLLSRSRWKSNSADQVESTVERPVQRKA
jgi:hypothetical protein